MEPLLCSHHFLFHRPHVLTHAAHAHVQYSVCMCTNNTVSGTVHVRVWLKRANQQAHSQGSLACLNVHMHTHVHGYTCRVARYFPRVLCVIFVLVCYMYMYIYIHFYTHIDCINSKFYTLHVCKFTCSRQISALVNNVYIIYSHSN